MAPRVLRSGSLLSGVKHAHRDRRPRDGVSMGVVGLLNLT
jgi:hypothetical protein